VPDGNTTLSGYALPVFDPSATAISTRGESGKSYNIDQRALVPAIVAALLLASGATALSLPVIAALSFGFIFIGATLVATFLASERKGRIRINSLGESQDPRLRELMRRLQSEQLKLTYALTAFDTEDAASNWSERLPKSTRPPSTMP